MTTTQIIAAIISSSVLSAALTSLVNWILHNSNYKKDYYKKILEKRFNAFEKVQDLAGKLSFQTQLDNSVIPTIFFNNEYYDQFIILLASTIDSSFWLDISTSSKLTELNVFLLNNITNNINYDWDVNQMNQKYNELGANHLENIRLFRQDLQTLVNKELKNLHKVERFFNNKVELEKSYAVLKSNFVEHN
nr:hypothetical protein [uncultured Flavobacterium sp.]